LVEEQEPEDVNHEDEVSMLSPHFDEVIQDPIHPTQEGKNEVNHFPFQVFDDVLFYHSKGEEIKESLDELDPSCCNEGDDMIDEFISIGRHRWDVIGHYGDTIYEIEGHFQFFPSLQSCVITTDSNIWKQGNDMITDVFQTPKDELVQYSHNYFWSYLEEFDEFWPLVMD